MRVIGRLDDDLQCGMPDYGGGVADCGLHNFIEREFVRNNFVIKINRNERKRQFNGLF